MSKRRPNLRVSVDQVASVLRCGRTLSPQSLLCLFCYLFVIIFCLFIGDGECREIRVEGEWRRKEEEERGNMCN